jgi:hypothetical protein
VQRKRRLSGAAPTTEAKLRRISPLNIVGHEANLLTSVRELYSHRPEAHFLEAWELQSLLFLLGYTNGLAPEAEIAAAMDVARGDFDPEGAAA